MVLVTVETTEGPIRQYVPANVLQEQAQSSAVVTTRSANAPNRTKPRPDPVRKGKINKEALRLQKKEYGFETLQITREDYDNFGKPESRCKNQHCQFCTDRLEFKKHGYCTGCGKCYVATGPAKEIQHLESKPHKAICESLMAKAE